MMKRISSYFHIKVDDYKKKDDKVKAELKRYVQYSKILETDDSLGIPEQQAAMEAINLFNKDMDKLDSNMAELQSMLDDMKEIEEMNMQNYASLEEQVMDTLSKQDNIQSHCEKLIDEINL